MPKKTARVAGDDQRSLAVNYTLPNGEACRDTLAQALGLGYHLLSQGQLKQTLELADALIEQAPEASGAHLLKLSVLLVEENLIEAKRVIRNLWNTMDRNQPLLERYAQYEMSLGRAERAELLLKQASKLSPDSVELSLRMGLCLQQQGKQKQALRCYERALSQLSSSSKFHAGHYLSALEGKSALTILSNEEKNTLNQLLRDNAPVRYKSRGCFILSQSAKRAGDDKAHVELACKANALMFEELKQSKRAWTIESEQRNTQAIIDGFGTLADANGDEPESNDSFIPVPILAMPRSGTTLLEQILGGHSLVGQTGESKAIDIALHSGYQSVDRNLGISNFPVMIDRFNAESWRIIKQYYVDHQRLYTKQDVVIDKNLNSHKFVGLMVRLFPKSRFLHLRRNPLDVILSGYLLNMPGVITSYSVEQLALSYVEMTRLIHHWKALYPEQVFTIDYQELVRRPEPVVRSVLQFLGLEWESSVLAFDQRANSARTMSLDQVREGSHDRSIGRWRSHKRLLQPAIDVLEKYHLPYHDNE